MSSYPSDHARWLCSLLLIAAFPAVADDMYKTVDAQGHVSYSDRPLSPTSQRISVEVTSGDPVEAARIKREQVSNTAAAEHAVEQSREDARDQARKEQQAAQQRQRCAAARSRYEMFAAGGRIFHLDDQGNRVYYSDQEIEQQRSETKAGMEQACSGP